MAAQQPVIGETRIVLAVPSSLGAEKGTGPLFTLVRIGVGRHWPSNRNWQDENNRRKAASFKHAGNVSAAKCATGFASATGRRFFAP
jgi:hypothetical protein